MSPVATLDRADHQHSTMATQQLLQGLESQWKEATVGHKFIKACVDGSIKPEQFNTWLAQVGTQQWVHCCLSPQLDPGSSHSIAAAVSLFQPVCHSGTGISWSHRLLPPRMLFLAVETHPAAAKRHTCWVCLDRRSYHPHQAPSFPAFPPNTPAIITLPLCQPLPAGPAPGICPAGLPVCAWLHDLCWCCAGLCPRQPH